MPLEPAGCVCLMGTPIRIRRSDALPFGPTRVYGNIFSMKGIFAPLFLISICAGGLMAQENAGNAPELAALVPSEVAGWLASDDEIFDPETIFDYINGAGEVYRSYNFRSVLARRFENPGGPDIVVDLFDMGLPEDALGVFTHDLEGDAAGVGQSSTYKGGLLSFWKDRYFVSVYAESETDEAKAAVLELGRKIASAIPTEAPRPVILGVLPERGLNTGTVRLFRTHHVLNYHFFIADGNLLDLGPETSAVLGSYTSGVRILAVSYPTADAAEDAFRKFREIYMPDASDSGIARTEDGRYTALRSSGRGLAVVLGAVSENEASDLATETMSNFERSGL